LAARRSLALLGAALCLAAGPAAAQQAAKPGVPVAAPIDNRPVPRTASLPAKGLFKGDQLSDAAKARLTDLIIDALGLDVEVALLVPTGPWNIDGGGHTDRDLNEARLAALRKFLTDRGIEPKRIFVESRIDAEGWRPRRYELEGRMDDARIQYLDYLPPLVGDADLRFDGPVDDLLLSGRIDIAEMTFTERIDWEAMVISLRNERLTGSAPVEGAEYFSMDLDVRAMDSIRLRNNIADADASARLRIVGDTAQSSHRRRCSPLADAVSSKRRRTKGHCGHRR
jgi:OOP family OmpA-OmpF porin